MRVLSGICVVAVLVLVAAAVVAQTIPGTVHKYDSYGFSVSLPITCQPVSLGNIATGVQLQEAYAADGLAYLVCGVTEGLPKGMNAHTIVRLAVQQLSTVSSKVPGMNIHLVSATTADGEGVQGFGMTVTENARSGGVTKIPTEVRAMFGSSVYQSVVLVPTKDSPAVIGVIAVFGPASREGEIISQLMQVTSTLTTGKGGAAGSFSTGASGLTVRKGQKGQPTAFPVPEVKSINKLKKGQIELVGVVSSTDAVGKHVDMLVGQAVACGGHGAVIDPPRLKRVYMKEIAENVKEGAIIIVVAKDTGPGKSVTADTLTVMDASKLGF